MAKRSVLESKNQAANTRHIPIACDICDIALKPNGGFMESGGWSYIWRERECGPASFAYVLCSDCCNKQHDGWATLQAMIKRAHRHSRQWGNAVDRYLVDWVGDRLIPAPLPNADAALAHLRAGQTQ